jgi:uncharacterized protein (TIGR00156 family)
MKRPLIACLLVLTLGAAASVHAQYQGPGSTPAKAAQQAPMKTVADVLKNGKDDQMVTLTGNVVKQVGREKFLFRDASGEIRIEIDDEAMPTQPFDDKTKVEITGEVEKDFLRSLEIDVKSVKLAP